jgi:hypothetical protein
MSRRALVARLDPLIVRLGRPATSDELLHHWTNSSKAAFAKLLGEMRSDALAGKELGSVTHYVTMLRGLDTWGISSGDLSEAIGDVEALAREL